MSCSVTYDSGLRAILILNSGEVSVGEIRQQTQEALALAEQHGARRFLMDNSPVTRGVSPLEAYQLPKLYAELGADRGARLAVVLPERAELHEDMRFFETVCRNQGFDVRLFASRREAAAWLET